MDMKKILQAIDGNSTKPVEGKNDMKKFLEIIDESKKPQNRLTTAESMAVQHYTPETRKTITNPVLNVDKDAKLSMAGKYFKAVEIEFAESDQRYKQRARQLAERVSDKLNGFYFNKPKSAKNLARAQQPPENIEQLAKQSATRHVAHEETEGVDSVTLDIPLLIRLLEFSREDAKDDMILHKIAERMIGMKEEGQSLSMSNYESIVGDISERVVGGQPTPPGINRLTGKPIEPQQTQPINQQPSQKPKFSRDYLIKAANPNRVGRFFISPEQAQLLLKQLDKQQSVSEAHGNSKIYDKCWTGYKKVPGKKRGEKGSCVKK